MPDAFHHHDAAGAPSRLDQALASHEMSEEPSAGPGASRGEGVGVHRERRAASRFVLLAGLITGTWTAVLIWAAQSLVFS